VTEVAAVDPTEQSGETNPSEGAETVESATAVALRELGDHRPPAAPRSRAVRARWVERVGQAVQAVRTPPPTRAR